MFTFDALILYVKNIDTSIAFYRQLLDDSGDIHSPTFASFSLGPNANIGLKQYDTALPAPSCTGGGSELSLQVKDEADLTALQQQWQAKGVSFIQPLTRLPFGLTFVATDPDEHRIRVWCE